MASQYQQICHQVSRVSGQHHHAELQPGEQPEHRHHRRPRISISSRRRLPPSRPTNRPASSTRTPATAQATNIANQQANQQFNAGQGNQVALANVGTRYRTSSSMPARQHGPGTEHRESDAGQQFNAGMNYNAQAPGECAQRGAVQQRPGYNAQAQNTRTRRTRTSSAQQNMQGQLANQAPISGRPVQQHDGLQRQNTNQNNAFNASQANNANRLAAYTGNSAGLNAATRHRQQLQHRSSAWATTRRRTNTTRAGHLGLAQQGQNYNQAYNTWQGNLGANQQQWNNNYNLATLVTTRRIREQRAPTTPITRAISTPATRAGPGRSPRGMPTPAG